jgi:predicted nucleic acid-binding protein
VIVVDACVWVEVLTNDGKLGEWAREQVEAADRCLASEHTRLEVANSIRALFLRGELPERRGRDALDLLGLFEMDIIPFQHVISRVWELRSTVTAYDAAYVAIAEQNQCPLVTTDLKLAGAPGPTCEFRHPQL